MDGRADRAVRGAALTIALCGSLAACSTTATIYREHEPMVEGHIVGGSRDSVFVQDIVGNEYPIRRSEIHDIDHPGNVHEVVGGAIFAYGLVNILAGYSGCQDRRSYQAAYCIGVFTPAVVGLAMMTWGLVTHSGSVDAAHDHSRPDAYPSPSTRPRAGFRSRPAPRRDVSAERVNLPEAPSAEPALTPAPVPFPTASPGSPPAPSAVPPVGSSPSLLPSPTTPAPAPAPSPAPPSPAPSVTPPASTAPPAPTAAFPSVR